MDSKTEFSTLEQAPKDNLMFLTILTFISAIGGFLFGYDTGVIGGANIYIYDDLGHGDSVTESVVVSIAIVGAVFGAGAGGITADKWGRKCSILFSDVVFIVGALVMALAVDIVMLIFGRLIIGFGVGLAAMVVPIYLAEAAPPAKRGLIVSTNVLFVTLGQLIAYCVCYACGSNWRLMLGISGVPAFIQLIGMFYLDESPRWLFKNLQYDKAVNVLLRIRLHESNRDVKHIKAEVVAINNEIAQEGEYPKCELLRLLFTKFRKASTLGIGLQVLQQLVGINTAMYYGPQIMEMVGFATSKEQAVLAAMPLAGANVLGTFVALCFVDNLGRRGILLWTTPIIALFLVLISVSFYFIVYTSLQVFTYVALTAVLMYVFVFAIGMGVVPWTVNSEIYPLHLRSTANSAASMANWVSNFVVSMSFLTLTSTNVGLVLAWDLLAGFAVLSWAWVFILLPETKDLSLEAVLKLFEDV